MKLKSENTDNKIDKNSRKQSASAR